METGSNIPKTKIGRAAQFLSLAQLIIAEANSFLEKSNVEEGDKKIAFKMIYSHLLTLATELTAEGETLLVQAKEEAQSEANTIDENL